VDNVGFDGKDHNARDPFAYHRNLVLIFFFADTLYWIALLLLVPSLFAEATVPFPIFYGPPTVLALGAVVGNLPFVAALAALYFLKVPERSVPSWFIWTVIVKMIGSVSGFIVLWFTAFLHA
jgi:hypothetical protein